MDDNRMPCWYYDKPELLNTPSIQDGISPEKELIYRKNGATFIIDLSQKLNLIHNTFATAVVFYQRFYMVTAACCVMLAGKVEETPKKSIDIIRKSRELLGSEVFKEFGDNPIDKLMGFERVLLKTIKFDFHVKHPYSFLVQFAKRIKSVCKISQENKALAPLSPTEKQAEINKCVQNAWTFINDSLLTTLCLQWEPEIIACAVLYLAAKMSKLQIQDWENNNKSGQKWWEFFVEGMTSNILQDICHSVLDVYTPPDTHKPGSSAGHIHPSTSSVDIQHHMAGDKRKYSTQPQPNLHHSQSVTTLPSSSKNSRSNSSAYIDDEFPNFINPSSGLYSNNLHQTSSNNIRTNNNHRFPGSLKILLLIFFQLLSTFAESNVVRDDPPKPKIQWDYIIFSQEWPPSVCLKRNCSFTSKNFNIHGLWPTINPSKQISACKGAPHFNVTQLEDIRKELENEWSDLYVPSNPKHFWKHEWTKHGTCAWEDKRIKQEKDYFKLGLDLKANFDTLNVMIKSGFSPSNQTKILSMNLTDSLNKVYGKKMHLSCIAHKGGLRFLTEVRHCIDPDFNVIDCPNPVKMLQDSKKKLIGALEFNLPIELENGEEPDLQKLAQENYDSFIDDFLPNNHLSVDLVDPWIPIDFASSNCGDYLYFPEFPP